MTATQNDIGHVALGDNVYQSCVLQFPGADTYVKGTILARKDVSNTIVVTYARTGTSTYTAVASTQERKTLKAGAYVVTAGTLSSGIGRWTCADPDGNTETFTTLAADDDIIFSDMGLILTVTATPSTVWDTGDAITATVAADGDVVIYDPDGSNGSQTPIGVLPQAHTTSGSADVASNIIIGGKVNKDRLVIDDGTTVTDIHVNLLKASGIYAVSQPNVSTIDNIV
jgi:hypothetical protein